MQNFIVYFKRKYTCTLKYEGLSYLLNMNKKGEYMQLFSIVYLCEDWKMVPYCGLSMLLMVIYMVTRNLETLKIKGKIRNAHKCRPWWFCLSWILEAKETFLFDLLRSYLAL